MSAGRRRAMRGLALALLVVPGCAREPQTPPPEADVVRRNNDGVGLMGRFEYDAARSVFAEVAQAPTDDLDVQVNLAISTFNRQLPGDEAQGLALLEAVLERDPDHERALYCAGLLRLRQGETGAAADHFRRVVALDPADAYAAYHLGQCLEQEDAEAALALFEQALTLDPYLRSAYYRQFQLLQRRGRDAEAAASLEAFERLDDNPRARLVEMKYTRMGPKAEVAVFATTAPAPVAPPAGDVFLPPQLGAAVDGVGTVRHLSAADIDGDGRLDLYVAGDDGGIVLASGASGWTIVPSPLAAVTRVNAALWGDVDQDGRTDVFLCRDGANALWLRTGDGWRDASQSARIEPGDASFQTVDGAMFDADHDGDLDVFCVNGDGPNELLNNNLDGTFRPLAADFGLAGRGDSGRQVLPVDLDGDRDLDLVVLNDAPPHEAYENDRLWSYHPAEGLGAWLELDLRRAAAADRDADGRFELYGLTRDGQVLEAQRGDDGAWSVTEAAPAPADGPSPRGVAVLDVTGDGVFELLRTSASGWRVDGFDGVTVASGRGRATIPVPLAPERGPALVGVHEGRLTIDAAGPGRWPFVALEFSGRTNEADSMRSNTSGIGTTWAGRRGSTWMRGLALASGPESGQSLVPVTVGLGAATQLDFLAIDWSDGVFQSELALGAESAHVIIETQRQLSSCPVVFAWNGERFEFVTDVLGVGGLGFLLEPGKTATPRPWEHLLLPEGALAPRDGEFVIKIGEPMEEVGYIDALRLMAWDLPPGWSMTLDERMRTSGPHPFGTPLFFRETVTPVRAMNETGHDVTVALRADDGRAALHGPRDTRFLGRLAAPHVLELEFDEALDAGPGAPALVADGWVEYPYAQTMFAAWQAGATYDPPTLEARGADGAWVVVYEHFGYPAGLPRQMALPLDGLPEGTDALRLTTNLDLSWDRIFVARTEPLPTSYLHRIPCRASTLDFAGFAQRRDTTRPYYDYAGRVPLWDTRSPSGWYTAYGDVLELTHGFDNALAVLGPGDEITATFRSDTLTPIPEGWTRRFGLFIDGWCKDMDLYTEHGGTVDPLPIRGADLSGVYDLLGIPAPADSAVELHRRTRTRYQSGR